MVAHRLGDKAKPLFVATEIALRQREARSWYLRTPLVHLASSPLPPQQPGSEANPSGFCKSLEVT